MSEIINNEQEENQDINPHTGKPVVPGPGCEVCPVTNDSWWQPKPEEQYHEHPIGSSN